MTVKGGADLSTVFGTVRVMMAQGKTVDQAIEKVESILRGKLPQAITILIRQECK